MGLQEFGELCKSDLDVDRELDRLLKQQMLEVQLKLSSLALPVGGHIISRFLRSARIEVDEKERARRVVSREKISIEKALEDNKIRSEVDGERFMELTRFCLNSVNPIQQYLTQLI